MKDCARYAPMLNAREGELAPDEARALAAHLESCEACRARLADERALSGLVGQALMAEANRRDFSGFADEVMARVGQKRAPAGGLMRLWARHRALVVGGALAPALAALALIVYFERGREMGPPQAGDVELLSEGHAATVLETTGGPIVLFGESDEPDGT